MCDLGHFGSDDEYFKEKQKREIALKKIIDAIDGN